MTEVSFFYKIRK